MTCSCLSGGYSSEVTAYGPPNPNASAGANAERHFERVSEFYLGHPDLRERVPLTFGEEFALVRMLGYCGVLREEAGPAVFWLV